MSEEETKAQERGETPQLQEQEGVEGWKAYIPTTGGWWAIVCTEEYLYELYFRATVQMSYASPPERPRGVFTLLSELYAYLAKAEKEENE